VRTLHSMKANLSGLLAIAPLALFALVSCRSEQAQWSPEKRLSDEQRPTDFGQDHKQRFGLRDMRAPTAAQGQQPASATGFSAATPAGWRAAAASEFRQLNWKFDSDPEAECYLTAGNLRGGMLANVNRWFGQFSKAPISQAEFDALPRHDLLGKPAVLVTIEGEFRGMGGNGKPGFMLLGLVGGTDDDMVTLKLVAKKATAETERERFLQLGASVRRGPATPAADGGKGSAPASAQAAPSGSTTGDGFVAEAPNNWKAQATSAFRQLNWTIGTGGAECYLTAGNLRGGKLANVNRWVGAQFGQPLLDEAQFAALEKHKLLGSDAALVSLRGEFKGMDGTPKSDYALLGLVGGTDEDMVTLKLTGPASVVDQERAAFLAVAATIRRAGEPAPASTTKPASAPVAPSVDAPAAPFAGAVPTTWQSMGDTGSRMLRHRFGQTGECYVGQLGGELAQMLSVWCGEMSQAVPDAAAIAALPKQPMLGGEGVLLDLRGEHRGTGGQARPGMRLLVAVKSDGQGVVFCKMLGSEGEVEQERANFVAFCQSLKRNDG
jgi:hypothetical protein